MYGFGGGSASKDSYGGPDEGVGGKGSLSPGVSSSGKGDRVGSGAYSGVNSAGDRDRQGPGNVGGSTSGKGDRVGSGDFSGRNSVGDRDRQGAGNVGNPDVDRGDRMGSREAAIGAAGISRAGDIGRAVGGVGRTGGTVGDGLTGGRGVQRADSLSRGGLGIDLGQAVSNAASVATRAARTAGTFDNTVGDQRMTGFGAAHRASEDQSMNDLASWGKTVKSVVAAGPGWTQVQLNDGTVEKRTGVRASRNNNPGNLEYGPRAKQFGAVGDDGRFAVFPSIEEGLAAQADLLGAHAKKGRTIAEAITSYAPPKENNTQAYINAVTRDLGVPASTKVSDVSLTAMARAMQKVENNSPYRAETISAATKDYGTAPATRVASKDATAPQSDFATKYLGGLPHSIHPEIDDKDNYLGGPAADTQHYVRAIDGTTKQGKGKRGGIGVDSPKVTQASAKTDEPKKQRTSETTAGKIAGAGLDVGMGFIPGVGMPLSIVNAGLSLTGNRTLGERLVDLTGEGTGAPLTRNGDANRPEVRERVAKAETTVPTPPAQPTFADKYLTSFKDDTKRPTPAERWGGIGV